MRGFPFPLAHIEEVVPGRTAPVNAARRLPGKEAAVLPEILARTCPPAPMQAVNHRCSNAASLENQTRKRLRKGGRRAARATRRLDLLFVDAQLCHLLSCDARSLSAHPRLSFRKSKRIHSTRALSRPITAAMLSPSARAVNVSAMRCLRI